MPKLVDYASRFDFIRESAFAVVRDRGVAALSRRAVAHELGMAVNSIRRLVHPDAVLEAMAANVVMRRREAGRWGHAPVEPRERAEWVAVRLVPEDETRIDEELVWLRLALAWDVRVVTEQRETVADAFHWAERGYPRPPDPDRPDPWVAATLATKATATLAPTTSATAEPEVGSTETMSDHDRRRAALAPYFAARDAEVGNFLRFVEADPNPARAMADGLTLAVCLGRLAPHDAVRTLTGHLTPG
ncbi:MAG: hypothetical protein ACR2K3_11600 [Nocardioides sp.]